MWKSLSEMNSHLIGCRMCPRLVEFREKVAAVKNGSYRDCEYWGKPVPGFGDPEAGVIVLGLAPGAHGSNRTGRMFTGDHSGRFLYSVLYEAGFSNQPFSIDAEDGLELSNCYITAALRCVPPGNKPTREELRNCSYFLDAEIGFLKNARVVVALGMIAFQAFLSYLRRLRVPIPKPAPRFGHGKVARVGGFTLIASYHPSRQNTQTGKLSRDMLLRVFLLARDCLDLEEH
jgi:uracil-DNA glycosylase family 4